MGDIEQVTPSTVDDRQSTSSAAARSATEPELIQELGVDRRENRRWWVRLFLGPAIFLASGVVLLVLLGVAQRTGIISSAGGSHGGASSGEAVTRYICPMMCTPPQTEPGRCPVCAMELVPATSGVAGDFRSVSVAPAARRVANIHTAPVESMATTRTIRAIGELAYDEGAMKTISAYVDGRLDRLYADYTGVVVKQGDHLALVYSPRLYSGQEELLLAKRAREARRSTASTVGSNYDLYDSARQRLIELGMTEAQIDQLEQAGEANSRMHLCAPISGTVIEKFAVEGQYVKEGQAIYKLADLSTVWLMLELFPEDAASIRYGQMVEAEVQSLPGRGFAGRVAFIDPNVNPQTRTVGVRIVIPNPDGVLRIGDYAKATIEAPSAEVGSPVYDPDLVNKWISPRHPHIVAEGPGACPICGVALVPAASFGFTDQSNTDRDALVVPRDAVLTVGANSVLYVETEPGRFEIRRVTLGPVCGDKIVVREGVELGELVATRGNFLIDSQMQLAGNPSVLDPMRHVPKFDEALTAEMLAALSALSTDDRALVDMQSICPVTDYRLGTMGTPKKIDVDGTPVFICCDACRESLLATPERHLAKLAARTQTNRESNALSPLDLPPIELPQLIEEDHGGPHTVEIPVLDGDALLPAERPIDGPTKRSVE